MTDVNVPEWEWASQEHPPQFLTRHLWHTAVATVAASAKRALPGAYHRIDQAVQLVLACHVELLSNGTAKVTSGNDPKTIYEVKGTGCTCPNALYCAKDGWCQHIFAALIMKRATTLVKQRLRDQENRAFPAQWGVSEPATAVARSENVSASYTLTFTSSTVDVMLTLHGPSEQALFPRIRHVLTWAKGLGACLTEAGKPDPDKSQMPTQSDQEL
jgi:hypothetical protein